MLDGDVGCKMFLGTTDEIRTTIRDLNINVNSKQKECLRKFDFIPIAKYKAPTIRRSLILFTEIIIQTRPLDYFVLSISYFVSKHRTSSAQILLHYIQQLHFKNQS